MKTKSYFFFAAALSIFAIAACNTNDNEVTAENKPAEQVPVTLTAQIESLTRGVAGATLNDNYIESDQGITVRMAPTSTTTFADLVYNTGSTGSLTPATVPHYYPTDGSGVDIRAYHPATAGAAASFSVQTNQSDDTGYIASDLMWSDGHDNVSANYDAPPQVLTFAHKLCKIVVNATGIGGITQINTITLKQVKKTVTFDATDGTVGVASGDATNITMLTEGTTSPATAVAIIPAQTAGANAVLEFACKNGSGTSVVATYELTGKEFTAAHVYTFTLNVSWADVRGTNEVTDWTDGGTTPDKIYTTLGS